MWTEQQILDGVEKLTLDQLVGQTLCFQADSISAEEYAELVKKTMPGGIYYHNITPEQKKSALEAHNKYCPVPTVCVADVENGAIMVEGGSAIPNPMAWGATDDAELIKETHHSIAKCCRKNDVHLALAPVVDINYNFRSSVVNIRAISDSPNQVIKIGRAAVEGFQQDNLVAACCKHFPGDGVDERNQHFMTTVNSLSKEEWMNTYGRVYREMIDAGTMAIMVAHIALPAFDEKIDDYLGYPPASLSKNLMQGLLRETLGFKGCIVSDALSMIGACSIVPLEKLSLEFLNAGGDMLLFPLPSDFDYIKAAVESGELPLERLKDAVIHIWQLNNKLGLLDSYEEIKEKTEVDTKTSALAQEIADKAINVIRDGDGILKNIHIKPGDKVLNILAIPDNHRAAKYSITTVEEELKARGVEVTTLINPMHYKIKEIQDDYDYILFNICYTPVNNDGSSMRMNWKNAMAMWRGYIFQHPRLIAASFGDPYKLYDYPYLKTYVNCFGDTDVMQRAYVRFLTGEIKAVGKSPIALPGFFERETD